MFSTRPALPSLSQISNFKFPILSRSPRSPRSPSSLKPQVSLLLLALATPPAFADTHTWTALSDNWSTPTNWSLPGPLAPTDDASLSFSDSLPRTITLDTDATVHSLVLDASAVGLLTFTQSANSFNSAYEYLASTGQAAYLQSGGTHSPYSLYLGSSFGSVGNYSLSNGLLTTRSTEYIGYSGTGSFTQAGGTHSPWPLYLGYNSGSVGNYSLSNGLLTSGDEYLGYSGTGSFTQAGGSHSISSTYYLGYNSGSVGNYTLQDGLLIVTRDPYVYEYVGYNGTGNFTQSGGTHSIASSGALLLGLHSGSAGNYTLSNGSLIVSGDEVIGGGGTGSFTQSGGTHSVSTSLTLDGSVGHYTLSNGLLTVSGTEYLGAAGTGAFTQSGGTHSVNSLVLGYTDMSGIYKGVGNYSLNNGLLTVNNSEIIGHYGTGNFTQTGGTHSVSGDSFLNDSGLYLGYDLNSKGNYTLNDGLLTMNGYADEYIGFLGTGSFTQTGGTHIVSTSLYLGYFFSYPGSVGTYTLNNGLLTVSNYGNEYLGYSGTAIFTQSGGTHSVSKYGNIVIYCTYILTDGLLAVSSDYGEPIYGNFTQSGGTHSVSSSLSLNGHYTLNNGLLNASGSEYLGNDGIGIFTQSGGTHNTASLTLGSSLSNVGNYSLSDGLLTVSGGEIIGSAGSATFTQSGGTHSISGTTTTSGGGGRGGRGDPPIPPSTITTYGSLYLGSNSTGSGSYALSGSGLLTASSIYVGGSDTASGGTASFYMSGGTATLSSTLQLWNTASRFDLTAGSLTTPTLNVLAGSFTQTGGTLSTSTLTQSGGSISLAGPQALYALTSLTLSAGTTTLAPHGSHLLTTTSLTLTNTATLDLTDNALLLQSTNPTADYTTLKNLLLSARNTGPAGLWSGPGLTSSLATHSGMELFGLALANASTLALTSFHGQTVDTNSLLVQYTYVGDATLDGQITSADYDTLDAHYLTGSLYTQGDFNYDGQVTLADYALLDHTALSGANPSLGTQMLALHTTRFGPTYPAMVPEPTTLSLLLLTAPLLLSRKNSLTRKTSLKKSQPR